MWPPKHFKDKALNRFRQVIIWIVAPLIASSSTYGLFLNICRRNNVLTNLTSWFPTISYQSWLLASTLSVLIFYTYFTYLISARTGIISAAMHMSVNPSNPTAINTLFVNYGSIPVEVFCKLHPTIYGMESKGFEFYDKKHGIVVHPNQTRPGWFSINPILEYCHYTFDKLIQEYDKTNKKAPLYFEIEFWCRPLGSKKEIPNPIEKCYYNVEEKQIYADY